MVAIDLSKQEALDPNPKAIEQINFNGNLERQAAIFFILEKAKKKSCLRFFAKNYKSNVILCFALI